MTATCNNTLTGGLSFFTRVWTRLGAEDDEGRGADGTDAWELLSYKTLHLCRLKSSDKLLPYTLFFCSFWGAETSQQVDEGNPGLAGHSRIQCKNHV